MSKASGKKRKRRKLYIAGFLNSSSVDTWTRSCFNVGVALCTVGYLGASLAATSWMRGAAPLPRSCDTQRCLQALPDVPRVSWGGDKILPSWDPLSYSHSTTFQSYLSHISLSLPIDWWLTMQSEKLTVLQYKNSRKECCLEDSNIVKRTTGTVGSYGSIISSINMLFLLHPKNSFLGSSFGVTIWLTCH